ncbi:beta-glucosidase [Pseudomonas putida]
MLGCKPTRPLLALAIGATLCAAGHASEADTTATARANQLLANMTQEEKISLVHGAGFFTSPIGGGGFVPGIERLGIPPINYADSSSGINLMGKNTTALPATLALAASWDPALAHRYGTLIGTELRTLGFAGGLGGGTNLAREPRNGRTFEYLGEDPLLAGTLLAERTKGTQAQHILGMAKHFAVNGQETDRFNSNSVVSERVLRELYLRPFEIAVKDGQPAIVMCAYNKVNGEKACENKHILSDILKGEWGFDGYVQSDWVMAVTDTARAANSGTDEEEPGSANDNEPGLMGRGTWFNQKLAAALQNGTVAPQRLDDMVRRKLTMLYRHGIMDAPPVPGGQVDRAAGDKLALYAAESSMVLLKNAPKPGTSQHAPLPLDAAHLHNVVVVGGHADAGVMGGGGSASVPARDGNAVPCRTPGAKDSVIHIFDLCAIWHKSSPLEAIRARLPGATVTYFDGSDAAAAAAAAAKADATIVFATQYTMEQVDLPDLSLPDATRDPANQGYDQNALIDTIASRARTTIVVLENGTAVTMPWVDKVQSVLAAWFPGEQGGPAIASILFGEVNPSGKLPITFPASEQDLPQRAISSTNPDVDYDEGLLMGYRRYDAQKRTPLFAFGHGLSYTHFSYSGLQVTPYANGDVSVSFTLTNHGLRAGAEVAQLYAGLPADSGEPPQRLVGWQKVFLKAGESRKLNLTLPAARFSVWSDGWFVPQGEASLTVGGSSRDAHGLKASFSLGKRLLAAGA